MANLSDYISTTINQFGKEIIFSRTFINILSDYQAFLNNKFSKTILRALIQEGFAEKIYNMDVNNDMTRNLKINSIILEVSNKGYQQNYVKYVVLSLVKALDWTSEDPVLEIVENTNENEKKEFIVNGVKFNFCLVEGGTFSMGATPEQNIFAAFDEKPAIEVTLSDFYLAETPVTQELWQGVMNNNPSHFNGEKLPVERISWDECNEFIEKLNDMTGEFFRLPTEAEWEYAARGGNKSKKNKYSGSDDISIDNAVWYKENSDSMSHPAKSKKPNEIGLYDMSGNISEWCSDWYFNSYSIGLSHTNPCGPSTGQTKVYRGGSWNDKAINCRVSKRNSMNPSYRNKQIGFRLAYDKK